VDSAVNEVLTIPIDPALVHDMRKMCSPTQDSGLYNTLFYFEAFVHKSIICLLPPPTCTTRTIAILLHVYGAIYDVPPTPLYMAYTIQYW